MFAAELSVHFPASARCGSGAPGETVTVAVRAADSIDRGEVTDRARPGTPETRVRLRRF